MTWAKHLLRFYKSLQPPPLPAGTEWLYPQASAEVMTVVERFLKKYFNDSNKRHLVLGINPGRFGAGQTGVNFTAARQLTAYCGIEHPFKMQSELSAEFIYDMIAAYGGVGLFYSKFFIGSVCTLGFIKGGKNINYYDDRALLAAVEPFIIETIKKQMQFPVHADVCFCIGGEKNFSYLSKLNEEYKWFSKIEPLPHPRFIMQYRRKKKEEFVQLYVKKLGQV